MALPGQVFTITDGNAGTATPSADRVLVVGVTSTGTANTITTGASPSAIASTLGYGPAVDTAAHVLAVAGGTVDVLKTAATVASANSAVVHVGTGPVMTVSGTPNNDLSTVVTVIAGGVLGTGTFQYSLENYVDSATPTLSEVITIPSGGTYAIPNTGVTLTFPAGTYVAGDTYSFTSTAAIYNSSDLSVAQTALLATTTRYKFIVFAGQQATSAAGATVAGAITGLLTALAAQFRFTRCITPTGLDTPATIVTAYASFSDARQMLAAKGAHVQLQVTISGRANPKLSFAVPLAARAAKVKISTNLGWVGGGPLQQVTFPDFDERVSGETFHSAKIIAPTTYVGTAAGGIFATNALLKSPAGSDFKYWMWGLVIDRACAIIYDAQQKYVNSFFRAKLDGTGSVDSRDAGRVNKDVRGQLDAGLLQDPNDQGTLGHCSGYSYALDETNNALQTGQIQSNAQVVGFINAEKIVTTIGLATSVRVGQ